MESEVISSRSELIKRARESCSNNLSPTRAKGNTQNYEREKKSAKERYSDGKIAPQYYTSTNTLDAKTVSMKLFMIRAVCAVILLLFVIVVDRLQLTYEELGSDTIKNYIVSNESVTEIEEFFVSLVNSIR